MRIQENPQAHSTDSPLRTGETRSIKERLWRHAVSPANSSILIVILGAILLRIGLPAWLAFSICAVAAIAERRVSEHRMSAGAKAFTALSDQVHAKSETAIAPTGIPLWDSEIERWNARWPGLHAAIRDGQRLAQEAHALPARFDERFGSIASAAARQEEAVEETASLVANMRQSIHSIEEQVANLLTSSDESASAILELGSSIEEVAANTGSLHETVDSSTSSVHQMSASIRQVATGAEQVQEMAESTAAAVTEMDRSVQEVSNNAIEAATLTERAHQGATAGRVAVRSTISDIEQISSLTTQAMDRLVGLVSRISQIGNILSAIDEINDETNLLSLNAAIIAAQAGEQGKAFLVVANHVKTLAQRTSASTQDIEKLIAAIEAESSQAVGAMQAGIEAVAAGVDRSRDAGNALESIQEACSDASERVAEIARATGEQTRTSKGVAEATLKTSTQIQQITEALAEQTRASESMLASSESALANCQLVHRATDEQRATSRHITVAIGQITQMIREIGHQTKLHREASESVSEAVTRMLDNAQASGAGVAPLREIVAEFERHARATDWPDPDAAPVEDAGPEFAAR